MKNIGTVEKKQPYKRFVLITGSRRTSLALEKQIRECFGDRAVDLEIYFAAADEGDHIPETAECFILSSGQICQELVEAGRLRQEAVSLICERNLDLGAIEKVIDIPKRSRVLLVNDSKQTAEDCIQDLLEVGVDHVTYAPYYPGIGQTEECEWSRFDAAVTAGEYQLVPLGLTPVVDLGPRIIGMLSMLRIAELLGIREFDKNKIIRPYTKKIIEISKHMTLVNAESESLRHTLRQQLQLRGHVASSTFSDILGNSVQITEARQRAEKLAKTELTVLIEGESGIGKELFASSIHSASARSRGPFLAVNFSALPEELLESQLFGYEEGAFTGAQKGGKSGLFERADQGTIFLDEIGDISPKMQTRLLRVLQEREIMPVGSSQIKKVNIRVIAATNKNLREMVDRGEFRADLYYRLKMAYVHIPPLRERKEDIRPLTEYFVSQETEDVVLVEEAVYRFFLQYDWIGNVRELANTVKYMLAVRNHRKKITVEDLPDEAYFCTKKIPSPLPASEGSRYPDLREAQLLLSAVQALRDGGENAGRLSVAHYLQEKGVHFTEAQLRSRLKKLADAGYVECFRGKAGTIVTPQGRTIINQ